MPKDFSTAAFFRRFPDDDACLAHLFRLRFGRQPACPKCGAVGRLRKLRKIPAYTCNCGHHVHPMQGTPFERSRTPLQKWFYAIFLFSAAPVPAAELQRRLGVTYKTAWRIAHEVRKAMATLGGPRGRQAPL